MTGRGKIRVRAVTDIEPMDNGKNRIVVTELPYLVNKARLIEKLQNCTKIKELMELQIFGTSLTAKVCALLLSFAEM